MKTYAEYLNTMTVKTLNAVAKDMGLKGYSKLRKAELVTFIDNAVAALVPVILDVESPADHDMIAALIAEVATVAPVTFSAAPVKAPESAPKATTEDDVEETTLDDLKAAYRNMRATVNRMGGRGKEGERRVRYVGQLRNLSRELQSMGIKSPQYL